MESESENDYNSVSESSEHSVRNESYSNHDLSDIGKKSKRNRIRKDKDKLITTQPKLTRKFKVGH